jgi:ribonuclease T2
MRNLVCLLLALAAVLPAAEPRKKVGEAGKFDYYMLTLSWSPAYCAGPGGDRNDAQCAPGRRFAFVLHGFWPQYLKSTDGGYWPQFCSTEPGLKDPRKMLDIMPSLSLVRHEWEKHGTCSGLDPERYFDLSRRAFTKVRIPQQFDQPAEYLIVRPTDVKRAFIDVNPGLQPSAVAIMCSSNYLSEVRICMDRDLRQVPCVWVRECRAPTVRVPPVR